MELEEFVAHCHNDHRLTPVWTQFAKAAHDVIADELACAFRGETSSQATAHREELQRVQRLLVAQGDVLGIQVPDLGLPGLAKLFLR